MNQFDPDKKLKTLGRWLHGLGLLIVLIVVLVAQLIVYRPIDAKLTACACRANKLQTHLRREDQVRAEHLQLAKDLADAQQQAETLQTRIPDEPREADFLAEVSKLAGEVGLQIQDYRPGVVTPRQSYSEMRVDLICEGGYASICNFLDRLSGLPRHSTVVRLEIDAGERRETYSATISLALYFGVNAQLAVNEEGTSDV